MTFAATATLDEIDKNDINRNNKIFIREIGRVFNIKRNNSTEKNKFTAISNVNLTVRSGEFLSIVGPSGCGKSTLLDLLAGLAKPTSGEILIDGKAITGPALDRGIVLQGYALFPWRTIRKNIEFGLEIKGVKKADRAEISDKFLKLVGLEGFADRFPYELSGGMKQRVAIARALAYDPEVLLMDEPFAAVDAQTRETMQDELLRIWEETDKTVVFVTHSIEEAVLLSDRVAVMSANPGTIKEIIDINLPRPRRSGDVRNSVGFTWITNKIWALLQNDTEESAKVETNYINIAEEISPTADI